MGNITAALASVPVPLIAELVIVPHLWHPTRWGSQSRWTPPNVLIREVVSLGMVMLLSVLSGVMSSLSRCKRKDYGVALSNAKWHVIGYIIGRSFAFVAFPLTAMLVAAMSWMPFAKKIAMGLITAVFMLVLGMFGNTFTRREVCTGNAD
jgi:hypothetical protein